MKTNLYQVEIFNKPGNKSLIFASNEIEVLKGYKIIDIDFTIVKLDYTLNIENSKETDFTYMSGTKNDEFILIKARVTKTELNKFLEFGNTYFDSDVSLFADDINSDYFVKYEHEETTLGNSDND